MRGRHAVPDRERGAVVPSPTRGEHDVIGGNSPRVTLARVEPFVCHSTLGKDSVELALGRAVGLVPAEAPEGRVVGNWQG